MKRDVSGSSLLEDLSAAARQRDLSAEERRQLVVGLATSAEARLAHRAGAEFDAEDAVLPGDDALIERIARRALFRPRARFGRLRNAGLVAAASICIAAASFGAPWLARRHDAQPQRLAVSSASARAGASSARILVPSGARTEPVARAAAASAIPAGEPAQPAQASPPAARTIAAHTPADGSETAAQLYAEANRARRVGQTSLAITRYADLQRRFGGSAEAQSADMALGMLALGQGRASVALVHFRRIVSRGASGGVLPEALWGQGQALAVLGQSDAARASYTRILDEYPDSAYAAVARARLAATP